MDTFYVAGNVNNPYQKQTIDYVVRTIQAVVVRCASCRKRYRILSF